MFLNLHFDVTVAVSACRGPDILREGCFSVSVMLSCSFLPRWFSSVLLSVEWFCIWQQMESALNPPQSIFSPPLGTRGYKNITWVPRWYVCIRSIPSQEVHLVVFAQRGCQRAIPHLSSASFMLSLLKNRDLNGVKWHSWLVLRWAQPWLASKKYLMQLSSLFLTHRLVTEAQRRSLVPAEYRSGVHRQLRWGVLWCQRLVLPFYLCHFLLKIIWTSILAFKAKLSSLEKWSTVWLQNVKNLFVCAATASAIIQQLLILPLSVFSVKHLKKSHWFW